MGSWILNFCYILAGIRQTRHFRDLPADPSPRVSRPWCNDHAMGDSGSNNPWVHFFSGFEAILANVEAHHHQKNTVPLAILDDLVLQLLEDLVPDHHDSHHRSL